MNNIAIYLIRSGVDVTDDGEMIFTRTKKDERNARKLLAECGATMKLYMPGNKEEDKAAEWEIV